MTNRSNRRVGAREMSDTVPLSRADSMRRGSVGRGLAIFAALLAGCGSRVEYAAPSTEDERAWEGIGYVGRLGDTAAIASISGTAVESPEVSATIGNMRWTVTSVRNIQRGITRAWPSIEERWVGVDLRIEPAVAAALDTGAPPSVDTSAPRLPDTVGIVLLRQQVVMIDDHGFRHHPMIVHDRLRPLIDEPIAVDSRGMTTTLFFGIRREFAPAAVEIHAPLGSARLEWKMPEAPGDWIPLNRKMLVETRSGAALWEIILKRVRPRFAAGGDAGGESLSGQLDAEVVVRNVARRSSAAPDPAAAGLCAGSGRTLRGATGSETVVLEPGQTRSMLLHFEGVPHRESLDLILPTLGADDAAAARINALPGFFPEAPVAMTRPAVSEGIRVSEYANRTTNGFAVRVGLLNSGARDLSASGLAVVGLMNRTGATVPGLVLRPPETLFAGFEERFWVEFPAEVSAIRVELPGRVPIHLKL
jgi:hypothetical protein